MTEVISVRFNNRGKAYYFDPLNLTISQGVHVIVETAKGIEFGECVRSNHQVSDNMVVSPLRPVVRIATKHDITIAQAGKAKEKEAFEYCQERILHFGIDMKLVDVEYGFDGNKILFFFTSEGRVDFRELLKDLAGTFRTRIELRQIGVRDEAKMLGGLGVCGRAFCCTDFLTEFHPVSIKMAKTQGLSLNPAKISGSCGRLMCCLKYEENAYEDIVKKAPKVDAFVETPHGKGSVTNVNLLRGIVKVRLEDGSDTTLKTFTFDELNVLGGKGRRAEYIAAKAEGRLEEAGFTPSPPPEVRSSFSKVMKPFPTIEEAKTVTSNETEQKVNTDSKKSHVAQTPDRKSKNSSKRAKSNDKNAQKPQPKQDDQAKPEPRSKKSYFKRGNKNKGNKNKGNKK